MALEAFKPLKKCPLKIEMHFAQCFFQMVRKYCTLREVHQIKECLTAQFIYADSRTDISLESLQILNTHILNFVMVITHCTV